MDSDSLEHRPQAVRKAEGVRMRTRLTSCCYEILHGVDNIVPFYAVLRGPQGSGKSLVVRQVFAAMLGKFKAKYRTSLIAVPLSRQHLTLPSALKHIRQCLCRDLQVDCTGKETHADNRRFIISLAESPGQNIAALFFEVDEIDLFLQDEQGRQVVDFLTGVACLASAKIKVGVIGMTSTSLQHTDKLPSFPYVEYEIPLTARENNAQGLQAHLQMMSSMLTIPSTWHGSAKYNQQISPLLQSSAVKQAFQTIIVQRDAAPFPGELAHACELMLAEGRIPSIQVVLRCLDAVFPVDLIVRHLRSKSAGDLLVLLALWHATGGCAQSVIYDVFCGIHDRIVRLVLRNARSEAAWEETRERKELLSKELLSQKAVRQSYETLLEEGFIFYAQAGDQMFVPPWYQSVGLCLRQKHLCEALQCIPYMLGVEEVWLQKFAFAQIHMQKWLV